MTTFDELMQNKMLCYSYGVPVESTKQCPKVIRAHKCRLGQSECERGYDHLAQAYCSVTEPAATHHQHHKHTACS